MDDRPRSQSPLDPVRLDEGLQRLRALGYLQTPAEEYLARRVGIRRSVARTALAAGLWIGGALGLLGALLLTASALISEPDLLQRPATVVWLWLELWLVLAVVGACVTGVAAGAVLVGRRRVGLGLARIELAVIALPALATSLYLADRTGRVVLEAMSGSAWWIASAATAIAIGALGAAVAWSMSSVITLARMASTEVERATRLSRTQRMVPWLVLAGASLALLVAGPYRGLESLPSMDAVDPLAVAMPEEVFVLCVEGVAPEALGRWSEGAPLRSVDAAEDASHPAAFWNEIATGFGPREHGVASAAATGLRGWDRGVGEIREDPLLDMLLRTLLPGVGLGETLAADRRDLRRPPVWEIAARAGRRARVVNAWATYPAARREGLEVVSDREFLRLDADGAVDSFLVWPPALGVAEIGGWRQDLQERRAQMPAYAEGAAWIAAHATAAGPVRALWDLATAADLHHMLCATANLDPSVRPTLVVAYLNGADILARGLRHRGVMDAADLLEIYDDYVRELLSALEPPAGYRRIALGRAGARGGDVGSWTRGPADLPSRAREWAAWLLWTQGIAPARDLALPSAFEDRTWPAERPATFGRLQAGDAGAARSDADLERLRSLGYIGG